MEESNGVLSFVREGISFRALNSEEGNLNYKEFWGLFMSSWEPYTLRWIQQYSDLNKSFLDIGGWIGPTSIWASKFFKSVHTFEPDPIAFKYLKENVKLNGENIYPYNAAITESEDNVNMFSRSGLGSSMTSMYTGDILECTAEGFPLSRALDLDDFNLIKIDIEGGERLIIDSFVRETESNPVNLIFSFHSGFYSKPEEDFFYIVNQLKKVYSKFFTENNIQINIDDVSPGFSTILCLK